MADLKSILDALNKKLESADLSKLKGVNAVFQFDVSGDDPGVFHTVVDDGKVTLVESAHDNPNTTITMAADDFMNMLEEKLSVTNAFMSGKLKVKGDMNLALKLQSLFG